MKIRIMIFLIILMIAIDQIIKIVINSYFLDTNFVIIPSLFEFYPKFNSNHSWVNDLMIKNFNIDLGHWFHIILLLTYQIIILLIYDFLRSYIPNDTKILDLAIVLQISEMICALSGNLIWEKGVLDYILFKPFFVFDLKDVYGSCFMCLFLLTLLIHRKRFSSLKMSDLILHTKRRLQLRLK